MMPFLARGMVTLKKVCSQLAPMTCAASSYITSTPAMALRIKRTIRVGRHIQAITSAGDCCSRRGSLIKPNPISAQLTGPDGAKA